VTFLRKRAELTGGGPLSSDERRLLAEMDARLSEREQALIAKLECELDRRADLARAAGAGQASGPEEGGP
jgi:hypothetical protein